MPFTVNQCVFNLGWGGGIRFIFWWTNTELLRPGQELWSSCGYLTRGGSEPSSQNELWVALSGFGAFKTYIFKLIVLFEEGLQALLKKRLRGRALQGSFSWFMKWGKVSLPDTSQDAASVTSWVHTVAQTLSSTLATVAKPITSLPGFLNSSFLKTIRNV